MFNSKRLNAVSLNSVKNTTLLFINCSAGFSQCSKGEKKKPKI
jgi:hypothetical protein